jgi:hypothetical protein
MTLTRHPERSKAESKDPVELPQSFAAGFLDFARNDEVRRRGEIFLACLTKTLEFSSEPFNMPLQRARPASPHYHGRKNSTS